PHTHAHLPPLPSPPTRRSSDLVNPAFASLNLAQAVAIVAYEWFKLATSNALPFAMPEKSAPAPKQQLAAFLSNIERELDRVEFRSEEHTSELQSQSNLVCRLLL